MNNESSLLLPSFDPYFAPGSFAKDFLAASAAKADAYFAAKQDAKDQESLTK